MILNINTDAAIKFTNTLDKLSRSALPVAVRGTLNSAVLHVKQKTMPKQAEQEFEIREKNFFKANSRVHFASGYNINTMQSIVGFIENNAKFNNYAVKELQQQESGGTIDKRSFIPLPGARVGKNIGSKIRANARLKKIKNIVDARSVPGKNKREQFAKAVHIAGAGGHVLSGNILYKIDSINKKGKYKKTALYSFKQGRKVNVSGTNFMHEASMETANQLPKFWSENATRTIQRYTS